MITQSLARPLPSTVPTAESRSLPPTSSIDLGRQDAHDVSPESEGDAIEIRPRKRIFMRSAASRATERREAAREKRREAVVEALLDALAGAVSDCFDREQKIAVSKLRRLASGCGYDSSEREALLAVASALAPGASLRGIGAWQALEYSLRLGGEGAFRKLEYLEAVRRGAPSAEVRPLFEEHAHRLENAIANAAWECNFGSEEAFSDPAARGALERALRDAEELVAQTPWPSRHQWNHPLCNAISKMHRVLARPDDSATDRHIDAALLHGVTMENALHAHMLAAKRSAYRCDRASAEAHLGVIETLLVAGRQTSDKLAAASAAEADAPTDETRAVFARQRRSLKKTLREEPEAHALVRDCRRAAYDAYHEAAHATAISTVGAWRKATARSPIVDETTHWLENVSVRAPSRELPEDATNFEFSPVSYGDRVTTAFPTMRRFQRSATAEPMSSNA